jgi:hypothetical protein
MNNDVTPTNAQLFIKYDVLTMLPTCFGLNSPTSGQYLTEIPGNYNMSYIKLQRVQCVDYELTITTPQRRHNPGIRI